MTARPHLGSRLLLSLLTAAMLLLQGCASVPDAQLNRNDPWERFNRGVFEFNEVVDKAAIKPVAQAYQAVLPSPVRKGVGNVFRNISDFWTSANLFAQLKPRQGLEMGMRGLVNTFVGVGGLVDVAEDMGLERFTVEDFGQTLGYWGIKSGPYLMLPVLGPSTLRDTAGLLVDFQDPSSSQVWRTPRAHNIALTVQLINTRVDLLNASRMLDEIALDKYVLLRDAYLSRRRSLIYDGEPPDEENAPAPFKSRIPSLPNLPSLPSLPSISSIPSFW